MKKISIGIIGYGSMGKMLFEKFSCLSSDSALDVFVTNRNIEKLAGISEKFICRDNLNLAEKSDVIFICVRPGDIKAVLEDIKPAVNSDKIVVSLNGSVSFNSIEKVLCCKLVKVIPSVTAEINKSQTLICCNSLVLQEDKNLLTDILQKIGNVIELPENEMGMGSELVSCMPGFIASIFDVICNSAKNHTEIPEKRIVEMVLNTLSATSLLMLEKNMSFSNVVERVATKGGITQEGTAVVYKDFPSVADDLFEETLKKRKITSEKAEQSF